MAHVAIRTDTSDIAAARRQLASGLQAAGRQLALDLPAVVRRVFDEQGAEPGVRVSWIDTSLPAFASRVTQRDRTYADVRRAYGNRSGWKTMQDTGTLRASWQGQSAVTGMTMEVQTAPTVAYGVQAHAGGPATFDGVAYEVPARPVFVLDTDIDHAVDVVSGAILG